MKQAHEFGFTWSGNESLLEENYYSDHENETCYRAWDDSCVKELTYQRMSYYQRNDYTLLEWSDYMKFTKEDLKVGMLVETNDGCALLIPYEKGLVLAYSNGNRIDLDSTKFDEVNRVWSVCNDTKYVLNCSGCGRSIIYERPTTKEMTVEEISEAFGYDVKIVKG